MVGVRPWERGGAATALRRVATGRPERRAPGALPVIAGHADMVNAAEAIVFYLLSAQWV